MVTVAVSLSPPSFTVAAGVLVPKLRAIDSSSSSRVSWVSSTVKVFSVSPGMKTSSDGTPEKSAEVAPPWPVATSGSVTVLSSKAPPSVTVTSKLSPSSLA